MTAGLPGSETCVPLAPAAAALALLAFAALVARFFFSSKRNSRIVTHEKDRAPFVLERMTDESAVFSTRVDFENAGSQCATVMDCFVRPQLPFEQYDGVDARGKAEAEGKPREDDYFEAILVNGGARLTVLVKVRLTARRGLTLKEALARMVDLPLDVVFTELGRRPWRLRKFRVVLTAEEIAALTGVARAED